jgi:hypothetical protein
MRLSDREIDIVAAERKKVILSNLCKSIARRRWQAPPLDQGTTLALHGIIDYGAAEGSFA